MSNADRCTRCKSESLWGTEQSEEYPGEWVVICNDCGKVQGKRTRRTPAPR